MSIETKYRPNTLDEVIGQDAVVSSLEKAIEKGTGRAFLFTGPSGCGKTTLARITAQMLGCDPADIQEEDAATKTGIDDVRNIVDGLLYRPLSGGKKAIIIDEAHALSKAATQALLKALEDPPSWVYWMLCTTEDSKIIKTIKTRCLRYQLKPVSTDDLFDLLSQTAEAKDVPEDVLNLCARMADGSPRQALSNLGVCGAAQDKAEAADLLRSAESVPAAFQLAQALIKGSNWTTISKLLAGLSETNPESVRHVVRAYMTKVVLSANNPRGAETAFAVLEEFSQPFNSSDGMSPLVLACGRLVLSERQ